MNIEEIHAALQRLASGEVDQLEVEKETFLAFRNVLVKREDFKHFRGIAQRGGGVIYHYEEEERS